MIFDLFMFHFDRQILHSCAVRCKQQPRLTIQKLTDHEFNKEVGEERNPLEAAWILLHVLLQ